MSGAVFIRSFKFCRGERGAAAPTKGRTRFGGFAGSGGRGLVVVLGAGESKFLRQLSGNLESGNRYI